MIFWNNWLIAALIATTLWAIVNIIDVYFVGRVFEDEFDSITVMAFFQILPWLAVSFLGFTFPGFEIVLLAIIAGFLNIIAMFLYFKALFTTNDASIISMLWNMNIVLMPIVAFFVIGEKLTLLQYGGILVAFVGATVISLEEKIKKRSLFKLVLIMLFSIAFLSASMLISDKVYSSVDFFDGFLFFSLGSFLGGIFFAILRLVYFKRENRISILKLKKEHYLIFIFAELLFIVGVFFSQRAIDLSPTVSFISVIESSQTFLILVISAILYIVLPFTKFKNRDVVKLLYKDQLVGYKVKIIASFIIAIGVYMLNV